MSALFRTLLLGIWLALAACTIQLVPDYDQALVDGVDKANGETLTLFASLEGCVPECKFDDYADEYASVIGAFDALQQRASSRQVPPLAARLAAIKFVSDACGDPSSCLNVTPQSLAQAVGPLRQMRATHKRRALTADDLGNFRNAYNPAIAQVLTIENALKR